MAGHSKWSNIKRRKGAVDAKRGKIFTRCIHEITTAVKEGGGPDPDANARLRLAIDKAKGVNMPSANIDKAIQRASGQSQGDDLESLIYEGYGPNGVAVLVEVSTDNKNRTVSEVRHAFSRSGGSLGENGCVGWMFSKKGLLTLPKEGVEEDRLMDVALEAGAEDIQESGDIWEVICEPDNFIQVKEALDTLGKVDMAEIQMIPSNYVKPDSDSVTKTMAMIEKLEDLDDVVNVYTNCEFPDSEE